LRLFKAGTALLFLGATASREQRHGRRHVRRQGRPNGGQDTQESATDDGHARRRTIRRHPQGAAEQRQGQISRRRQGAEK